MCVTDKTGVDYKSHVLPNAKSSSFSSYECFYSRLYTLFSAGSIFSTSALSNVKRECPPISSRFRLVHWRLQHLVILRESARPSVLGSGLYTGDFSTVMLRESARPSVLGSGLYTVQHFSTVMLRESARPSVLGSGLYTVQHFSTVMLRESARPSVLGSGLYTVQHFSTVMLRESARPSVLGSGLYTGDFVYVPVE